MMLRVDSIDLFYGSSQALRQVSLKAEAGKVTFCATALMLDLHTALQFRRHEPHINAEKYP